MSSLMYADMAAEDKPPIVERCGPAMGPACTLEELAVVGQEGPPSEWMTLATMALRAT